MVKNTAPKLVKDLASINDDLNSHKVETSKEKITVANDRVTVTHKWRPDDTVKDRREHTATFDFTGVSREELIRGFAKSLGVAYVQGKLRTIAKVSGTVDDKAFAEVNVKTEIVDAARGSKATLTPDQEVYLALKKQGLSSEQLQAAINAINAVRSQS